MLVGVHWNEVDGHRIDLDLSANSLSIGKIGWDSSYRNNDRTILFSGDVTSAEGKNGASELFYVKVQEEADLLFALNYYNYDQDIPVPFSIVIGQEQPKNFGKNYMIDPNNIVFVNKTVIDQNQKILGLLVTNEEENRFYFTDVNIGNSISLRGGHDYVQKAQRYLYNSTTNMISLKDVLKKAGAGIVDAPVEIKNGENKEEYVDLSPEKLEKDTILNLLVKKKK